MLLQRRLLFLLTLILALPAAADIAPTSPRTPTSGWSYGFRLGYAHPLGYFAKLSSGRTAPLSEEFSGQIPVSLEVGYRLGGRITFGGYMDIGYPFLVDTGSGLAAQECHIAGVAECSGNVSLRTGLQLHFHFAPGAAFQPWIGVGAGYEKTVYLLEDDSGGSASVAYAGWELFNLQLGGDFQPAPGLAWGPYVALSVAQYSGVEISSGNQSIRDISIASQKLHEWLHFGVRVRFGT